MIRSALIKKYNTAAPRYTSYPVVPYWDNSPSAEQWKQKVKASFNRTNLNEGISLYIHLPYCESLCTYCGCNTRITVNHSVEETYILAVLKEWKMYLELFDGTPVIREIHLGGGTPTFFSPKNLKLLLRSIISTSDVHKDAEFSFEAHPNNTTVEHLKTLHDLGFRRMSLGVQDFDSSVQEIVNRVQSYESVERITKQAREIGYTSVNFDLIYGLPLQKKESIIDTIEKVKLLKPDRIAFYSYAHVPWIKPGQRKFTEADLPADEEKRGLYDTGRKMLEEAGYYEIGMDHFALKTDSLYTALKNKILHRNFMGYTNSHTELMIGLGVSAISDTWDTYAQNAKVVEDYLKLLNDDRLPAFRGHVLTPEDLILRKHILNLMCRLETSWENESEQNETVYDAVEKLKEMKNDGLVEISPYHLKVTESGRAFLRNVCMAFDARLQRKIQDINIFSRSI
jgi:oxygen-independent coproporphyrinogen-3 oxidase